MQAFTHTYTSGCSGDVLSVLLDGTYTKNGVRITEPHWPEAVETYRGLIDAAARKHDVAPALIAGVMAGESRGKPNVVSPVGAVGLMQVMPQYFGGNAGGRLYDPATNIEEGVGYLAKLQQRYEENPVKMLAGYNAGSAICRAGAGWGLKQNTGYIDKCLGYANDAMTRGFSPWRPSKAPSRPAAVGSVGWAALGAMAAGAALYLAADLLLGLSDRAVEAMR